MKLSAFITSLQSKAGYQRQLLVGKQGPALVAGLLVEHRETFALPLGRLHQLGWICTTVDDLFRKQLLLLGVK